MSFSSHLGSFHFPARLGMVVALAGFFLFAANLQSDAAEQSKTMAADQDDDDSDDWMFDQSTYTNDPKTGKRVDQYKKEKTPYRDPNALFDSSIGGFPFFGDFYSGFYYDYSPYFFNGMWPEMFSQYYIGNNGSGYYPYDGDPNDEEDDLQGAGMKNEK